MRERRDVPAGREAALRRPLHLRLHHRIQGQQGFQSGQLEVLRFRDWNRFRNRIFIIYPIPAKIDFCTVLESIPKSDIFHFYDSDSSKKRKHNIPSSFLPFLEPLFLSYPRSKLESFPRQFAWRDEGGRRSGRGRRVSMRRLIVIT